MVEDCACEIRAIITEVVHPAIKAIVKKVLED
jgi:hypothetical protein